MDLGRFLATELLDHVWHMGWRGVLPRSCFYAQLGDGMSDCDEACLFILAMHLF